MLRIRDPIAARSARNTEELAEVVRELHKQLCERRIHSLPVVDDRKIIGIVSATDFTKAIAREGLL